MIFDEPRVIIRTEKLNKLCRLGNIKKDAIRELDLRVMQGEFVIVEGLYGAGKNAFFNLMGCVERPDSGKYYFDYEDIALASQALLDTQRKYKLGYLFRDYNLMPLMTVAQNLEFPLSGMSISRHEKQARIKSALEYLELLELAGEKAGNLSDYNKQLVALARAIINKPLMIIADEPAANLSSKEEQLLMEHLVRLNDNGVTIMLITDKSTMKDLNKYRLITFEEGSLVSDRNSYKLSLVRREA